MKCALYNCIVHEMPDFETERVRETMGVEKEETGHDQGYLKYSESHPDLA